MKKKYLLLSAIEGACVMGTEIVSAKLLTPFYGSSLYVWSTVLALTLGGLAIGYFYGGLMSVKKDIHESLRKMLYLATLCMTLMPFISYYGVPYISYLPFYVGIFISAFVLILPPLFFLGSTSPLFIALQTEKTEEAGKVGGTVYAVSTLGGIVAAFASGFFLIPQLGLKFTAFFYALILAVATFLILRKTSPSLFLLPLAVVLSWRDSTYSQQGQLMYRTHGILGECEVTDYKMRNDSGGMRQLCINKIIQTEMDVKTGKSLSDYLKQLDTLIAEQKGKKALVLGLGGGLSANLLVDKGYEVEAVELDERVIHCAKAYFNLYPSVKTIHDDARRFLSTCKKQYDVILVDVFKAEEQPSHVLTLESLLAIKNNNMQQNAEVWINWHGYVSGEIAKGTYCLVNTLQESGFEIQLFTTEKPESQRNTILKAILSDERMKVKSDFINTDDSPTLEFANAQANKTWREQYLRFYQNRK
jgi:predicted membrane-bound spermidine synthase